MAGIFISYRRADSDGWAGRLRDTLRMRFGNRVFQDVESIADGEIFSEVIGRALQECDVALIIIGPNWASAHNLDGRRLDQPEDWVRTETSLVLNRGIRVIPVLVGGAQMPRAEDLPEELRSLTKRQAREIRSNSWDSDVALLTNHLKQIVGQGQKRRGWVYAATALAVLAIGVFAASKYWEQATPSPMPAERPAEPPVVAQAPAEKAAPAAKPAPAPVPTPPVAAPAPAPVITAPAPAPAPKVIAKEVPVEKPIATPAPAKVTKAPASPPQVSDPPKMVARSEPPPPPVKAAPEASPQEVRKPAAPPPAAETPAAPATQVASLNLPNRPAAARDLKVGDTWTYRLREARLDRNLGSVTHEISGGDKGGIRETLRLGARGDTQRRLPLEPRIFEQPLDQGAMLFEFSPFMTAFSDLQPGVSWSKITGASSADQMNTWRISGKVTGRERVRVPAGSFDAIKADLEGHLDGSFPTTRDMQNETFAAYQTYTVWFAPEVGRAVKYERRTYNRVRRLLEHEQYELMSYKLQ